MKQKLTAACIQLNSGPDIAENLEIAGRLVREARERDADFIALPENATMLATGRKATFARALPEPEHPALPFFTDLARETGATILLGSLAVRVSDEKLANRSYLVAPTGIIAHYDKIHMFDVDLGAGERYRESETFRAGSRAVLGVTEWGAVGLTICYDVRFPHLYRALAKAGAAMLTVPSAFTVPTGRAHWRTLLRARAIETGCFIVAPAQTGTHDKGRQTYGHSLIVSPWGEVLADAGEAVGVVTAEIDLTLVAEARSALPSLFHDRDFASPEPIPASPVDA